VVIGAITNGRGNPFHMPSIAKYFEFCVSGEDAGVFPSRKPDRGIYEVALNRYSELMKFSQTAMSNHDLNWIHVGDDLANDVGASAACGAKTIWFTGANSNGADGEKGVGFWSTATPDEMKMRQELDELAKQFTDAEIYALNGLSDAIRNILNKR